MAGLDRLRHHRPARGRGPETPDHRPRRRAVADDPLPPSQDWSRRRTPRHTLAPAAAIPLAPALALAAPATWAVDKAASKLPFSSSVSGQAFTGRFARWDAAIHFDPKDLA